MLDKNSLKKDCIHWLHYFKIRYLHKHNEPRKYLFENIKANDEYKKICYNQENIKKQNNISFREKINNIVYSYFQIFPDKSNNKKMGDIHLFFPKEHNVVNKFTPFVFYEGIQFNNFTFDEVDLNHIWFYNCTFVNCTFIKMKTYGNAFTIGFPQGFSACDFIRCTFKDCELKNVIFEVGNMESIEFHEVEMINCMFNRMSFSKVAFSGNINFNNTHIFSPSKSFELIFKESIEQIKVNARCYVTEFNYYDVVNFELEEWIRYRKNRKKHYNQIYETYYILEQIWQYNCIKREKNKCANFYYQRKKAETRKEKNIIKKILGYLSEWILGYGEKPFNTILAMLIFVVMFGIIYMYTGFVPANGKYIIDYDFALKINVSITTIGQDFIQSLYFSFFTLITVGQGTAYPNTGLSQIFMCLELLIGAIMITLFTGAIFRKITD